jgi:ABC-type Na+ efflux pump permease subunit
METNTDNRKTHVSVGKVVKKDKRFRVVIIVLVILVVFGGGVVVGRWWQTQQYEKQFIETVGETPETVAPTEVTLFGKAIKYTEDKATNLNIDRQLVTSVNEKQLQSADISDVVTIYVKASDIGATEQKPLIEKVLTARVSELSSAQKLQLETVGLNL